MADPQKRPTRRPVPMRSLVTGEEPPPAAPPKRQPSEIFLTISSDPSKQPTAPPATTPPAQPADPMAALSKAQTIGPAPEPGPATRFAQEATQSINPSNINEMVQGAFWHPIDTVGAILNSHEEMASQAFDAFRRGDYVTGLARFTEWGIPIAGGVLGAAGGLVTGGPVGAVAGGLGGYAGGVGLASRLHQAGEYMQQGDYARGLGATTDVGVGMAAAPILKSSGKGIRDVANQRKLLRLAKQYPKQAGRLTTLAEGGTIAKPQELFSPLNVPENMLRQLETELAIFDKAKSERLARANLRERQRILTDPNRAKQLVELSQRVEPRRQPGVERGIYVGQTPEPSVNQLVQEFPSFRQLAQEGVHYGPQEPVPGVANMGETVLGQLESGGHVQDPITQARLGHYYGRGLGSPTPSNWHNLRDALLPAFDGDRILARRFADVVGPPPPPAGVVR